ncbi:LTA synthase family protein [Peptoniphilus sp. oral taxon 386]|uniref:LTA synthase family protein n=1 Tax=Peptoniphilus sp. oral taxon 386 TaxID=652713 RepID=UPI0002DF07FB|nr:LTA synthase family protein [Peptoniphilus sp. oral taxon 386]
MEKKKMNIFLCSFLLAILITATSIFISSYGYCDGIINNFFVEYKILLFNFIPAFLIVLALAYLLKSLSFSFLISSLVINLGAFANYIKIVYREEPLFARDITLIREAFTMSQKYDLNFKSPNAIVLFSSMLLSIVIFFILRRFEYGYKFRAIGFIASVIILAFFSKQYLFDYSVYHLLGAKTNLNMWIEIDSYKTKGFLYPFIYSIKSSRPYKYSKYNKIKAVEDYNKYIGEDIPEDQKVNIVCIMLESFKDFYKYQNPKMEFERNPYEYFHKLQNESIHGQILVNSFGGGTFLTESNFMTGYKDNPPFNRTTQSYVRYFKEQGYSCFGFHPFVGSFYNRNNAYRNLGFDKFFEYNNTFKAIDENILMDVDFYPFILKKYDEQTEKGPYFSFAVTYQNHGPYSKDVLINKEPAIKWQEQYDREWYNYFNNYLEGIEWASDTMKMLTEHFRKNDKPTILIMFGDHCPSMGDNKIVFDMFGINDSADNSEGLRNLYETPYIIWANDAAKKVFDKDFTGEGRDVEPAFLMNELFSYVGWKGSPYNQCIDELTKHVTVLKQNWYCIDGEFSNKTSEYEDTLIDKYRNVEYYVSHMLDKQK